MRRRFIEALLDACGAGRRTTVVLGVRADFLAHCSQHAGLVDALRGEAQMLVGPMAAADLREVIVRPAANAGVSVDSDLVATVLADAAGEPGALPLVSHALLETWQRREGPVLSLRAYHATGGMRGAIAQTAERVYDDLNRDERHAARRIFLRLTTLGDGTEDTRRPITRAELDGLADPAVTAGVPQTARIWNYWLGGKDNFPVDRQVGDQILEAFPAIVENARTSRAFLARAVRYLAGEAGIRQFLDIGTGLPPPQP